MIEADYFLIIAGCYIIGCDGYNSCEIILIPITKAHYLSLTKYWIAYDSVISSN